jgi:trigger factor
MRATASATDETHMTIHVELEPADIDEAVAATAAEIGREVTIKGFRKGKVPRKVVEAHMGGAAALRTRALSEQLSSFFARAVSETGVEPIGIPDVDVPEDMSVDVVVFDASVEVRPLVEIAGYRELRVTIPSPIVTDDEVERHVDRLRDTDAELNEVDRPIVTGDVLVIDVVGTTLAEDPETNEVDDLSYTVGSAALGMGIDELLLGLRSGETLEAVGHRDPAAVRYKIDVKKVSERVLPELTDEWVVENTEHGSVDALRDDILSQLRRMKVVEAKFAQRDAALVALSDLVPAEVVPEQLRQEELGYRVNDLERRLESQQIPLELFLEMTKQTTEQITERLADEAVRAVRVDLALRALARAEGLGPDEGEIDAELETTAGSMRVSSKVLRQNLFDNGRLSAFTAEIAKLNASKWLMSNVTYVDESGAEIDKSLLESPDESVAASVSEAATDGSEDTASA